MDTLWTFFCDVLALSLMGLGGMIIAEARRLYGFAWAGAVAVAVAIQLGGLFLLKWSWGLL